ncbi:MAG: hypothetical protein CVU11_08515 [Bacteroidetes bacterium HGW-Bacteroidetes-6]|jgi:hypothetical protein|nr:MAG: hypothetical protein CVU11_08515 [Bacteroidetes bacterium HGW-Bacteroidetes-6]
MKLNSKIVILSLFVVILAVGCKKGSYDVADFKQWLSDEGNGMKVSRVVGDLEFIVEFIPSKWYAYNECVKSNSNSQRFFDSICDAEKNNIRFEFEITPTTESDGRSNDIMFKNVTSYQEYSDRFYSMNFDLASRISLSAGGETIFPVFALFENSYGLSPGRKSTVLFSLPKSLTDWMKEENIVFNYDDEDFGTGPLHFVFTSKSISSIPDFHPKDFHP